MGKPIHESTRVSHEARITVIRSSPQVVRFALVSDRGDRLGEVLISILARRDEDVARKSSPIAAAGRGETARSGGLRVRQMDYIWEGEFRGGGRRYA